jgi:transcriptional regulator with XRE-family HTH domain
MIHVHYANKPVIDNRATGRSLREARTASGISQEQLAEAAGFTKQYISMLEHGDANFSIELIEKLERHI